MEHLNIFNENLLANSQKIDQNFDETKSQIDQDYEDLNY